MTPNRFNSFRDWAYRGAGRFAHFALVGLSGLVVNSAALAFSQEVLVGVDLLVSVFIATLCSTVWNFILSEYWVFRDRRETHGRLGRFVKFILMNNATLIIRGPLILLLTDRLNLHYLLANVISVGVATVIRYLFAESWVWREAEEGSATRQQLHYHYNLHSLLTVVSAVILPELEPFRTNEPIAQPTLKVQIGFPRPRSTTTTGRSLFYSELFGPLGFQTRIDIDTQIVITASPLLVASPHVLYTNIVEPVLRWTFAEMGYALVHGACLAVDDRAYLITARTDTGKTTTLLQILRFQKSATASFISDDLTLVAPDGQVWTYPKPLTISSHTVQAINAQSLSPLERFFLPFQSRIHSRNGRKIAHWLGHSALPMATVNAVVQSLVPPPKYFVQQLVPESTQTTTAKLSGMFIIERDEAQVMRLPEAEALNILLQNCEDAYGFPPYATLAPFLYTAQRDLREVERAIITSALRGIPSTLIRSQSGWWQGVLQQMGETPPEAERSVLKPLPV